MRKGKDRIDKIDRMNLVNPVNPVQSSSMYNSRSKIAAVGIAGCLLVLLASGCGGRAGPERAAVGGRVTADGQPVQNGSISFVPTGDTTGPSSGGKITGGSYNIARQHGPVVGRHRVEIRAMRKTGRKVEAGQPAPPGTLIDETEQFIPPKYNTQSELTAEIQPGSNDLDFDLQL